MQHGLPLFPAAREIALLTILLNRCHVARDRPPASDLPSVVSAAVSVTAAAGTQGRSFGQ
jgi:hypothetical protein